MAAYPTRSLIFGKTVVIDLECLAGSVAPWLATCQLPFGIPAQQVSSVSGQVGRLLSGFHRQSDRSAKVNVAGTVTLLSTN